MFVIPVVTLDEGALPISTVLQNITTHTDLKSKAAEVHLLNRKLASMDSQSIQDTEEQCFPVILDCAAIVQKDTSPEAANLLRDIVYFQNKYLERKRQLLYVSPTSTNDVTSLSDTLTSILSVRLSQPALEKRIAEQLPSLASLNDGPVITSSTTSPLKMDRWDTLSQLSLQWLTHFRATYPDFFKGLVEHFHQTPVCLPQIFNSIALSTVDLFSPKPIRHDIVTNLKVYRILFESPANFGLVFNEMVLVAFQQFFQKGVRTNTAMTKLLTDLRPFMFELVVNSSNVIDMKLAIAKKYPMPEVLTVMLQIPTLSRSKLLMIISSSTEDFSRRSAAVAELEQVLMEEEKTGETRDEPIEAPPSSSKKSKKGKGLCTPDVAGWKALRPFCPTLANLIFSTTKIEHYHFTLPHLTNTTRLFAKSCIRLMATLLLIDEDAFEPIYNEFIELAKANETTTAAIYTEILRIANRDTVTHFLRYMLRVIAKEPKLFATMQRLEFGPPLSLRIVVNNLVVPPPELGQLQKVIVSSLTQLQEVKLSLSDPEHAKCFVNLWGTCFPEFPLAEDQVETKKWAQLGYNASSDPTQLITNACAMRLINYYGDTHQPTFVKIVEERVMQNMHDYCVLPALAIAAHRYVEVLGRITEEHLFRVLFSHQYPCEELFCVIFSGLDLLWTSRKFVWSEENVNACLDVVLQIFFTLLCTEPSVDSLSMKLTKEFQSLAPGAQLPTLPPLDQKVEYTGVVQSIAQTVEAQPKKKTHSSQLSQTKIPKRVKDLESDSSKKSNTKHNSESPSLNMMVTNNGSATVAVRSHKSRKGLETLHQGGTSDGE